MKTRVPSLILAIAGIVSALGVVMMFLGTRAVGVTWDEKAHASFLEEYFTSGWNIGGGWLEHGELAPFLGKWPYFVYAPVSSWFAHAIGVITGTESTPGLISTADAYATRHIASAILALLGIAAVALTVQLITRSWRWAVLGTAVICAVPMWIGHGMFNIKDTPVGTGYALATLGIVALVRVDYGQTIRLRLIAYGGIVLGLVIAVGTRPASGVPVALTIMGILAAGVGYAFFTRKQAQRTFSRLRIRLIDLIAAPIIAYVCLLLIYPNAFANPYRLIHETVAISGRFPVNDPQLTNGVWQTQPVPWTYLPTWFIAQLPLLVLVFSLIFCGYWLVAVLRTLRRRSTTTELEGWVLAVPVIAQVTLLPTIAILGHATMYNSTRQFIFVAPAAAILATLGIRSLVNSLAKQGTWISVGRYAIWVLVAVGLLAPTVDQLRLYPYNYVYFNELATLKPINGNWATDYWRASSQELTRIIPPVGPTSCIYIDEKHPARPCDVDTSFEPFWNQRGADAQPGVLNDHEYWLVRENGGPIQMPPGCTLQGEITRPLRGEQVIIGQVAKCMLPAGLSATAS